MVSPPTFEEAAARVDSGDHLGGCAGALLAGAVLIPALSLPGTLALAAVLRICSAGVLLFSFGRGKS